ncbi:unnamed protein product [Rotaria sordida]|uniref:Uncharacterized protein n=1 Tax=Rotaria sordida TaxID=392033 RepID=A0A814IDU0_9BILA|nr:unnamed protein product [Rotaria sordida]CAF3782968.1 unnamed protein product [Rotaria sordida]
MASDNEINDCDYYSEDYFYIYDQITLFESRQSMKNRKTKRKIRKSLCSIPTRTLKSFPTIVKGRCMNHSQTSKAEKKSFRYDRYPKEPVIFECDRVFNVVEQEPTLTSTSASNSVSKKEKKLIKRQVKQQNVNKLKKNNGSQSMKPINYKEQFDVKQLTDFTSFRSLFYQMTHHLIKTAFDHLQCIKIIDIRLASVDEFDQDQFIKILRTYTYFPQLVYFGTEINDMISGYRYSLLRPFKSYQRDSKESIYCTRVTQADDGSIFCNSNTIYTLTRPRPINTLLVCAALPERSGSYTRMEYLHDDIVLREKSRSIPLFLLDVTRSDRTYSNYSSLDYQKSTSIHQKKKLTRNNVVSKKYLRKVLRYMNDKARINDLYQIRQDQWN